MFTSGYVTIMTRSRRDLRPELQRVSVPQELIFAKYTLFFSNLALKLSLRQGDWPLSRRLLA